MPCHSAPINPSHPRPPPQKQPRITLQSKCEPQKPTQPRSSKTGRPDPHPIPAIRLGRTPIQNQLLASFYVALSSRHGYRQLLRRGGQWRRPASGLRLHALMARFLVHASPAMLASLLSVYLPAKIHDPQWLRRWTAALDALAARIIPLLATSDPEIPAVFSVFFILSAAPPCSGGVRARAYSAFLRIKWQDRKNFCSCVKFHIGGGGATVEMTTRD